MKRTISYTIPNDFHNKTIEQYLKAQEYPHQTIVQLKKTSEGILRNGVWAYVTEKLESGDILTIHLIEEQKAPSSNHIQAIPVDFCIVYEDEDILVIDKPANMPIHPSMNHHEGTLANGLMYYFQEKKEDFTFRCINRLDRDTTGLTIVAKHMLSAGILSRQVANREIHRTYQAICSGKVPESGTIDKAIARTDNSTIERCVNEEIGEYAITHYKRLAYSEKKNLSLVELKLETGRTHQIRVHMKYIGYPIIGDFLYNPDYRFISRQALHSANLTFTHPITKKLMHFEAPLHFDMQALFE
ncbi:MAG: RluA family pseudouridine synthase [Lachnospiraceae bacterium]|nr:RluA family pseudouridine synthase [Lachnospiraceae bacterium]